MNSRLVRVTLHATLATFLLIDLIVSASAWPTQGGNIQGKRWVVSVADASNVQFPRPSATPDATFTTNGIAYIGQDGKNHGHHCYTIGRFLAGCPTAGFDLKFSGLTNPILGKAVDGNTPMSGPNYGIIIEFTGSFFLRTSRQSRFSTMTASA